MPSDADPADLAARPDDPALEAPISEAVAALARGELVAYPTETVWGLAADAGSPEAVSRLLRWKGRVADQPIAVLVSGPEQLGRLGCAIGEAAGLLSRAFWPGPLTLVLPCSGRFAASVGRPDAATGADEASAAESALGVRCSPHPVAHALARASERAGLGPPTATSLNRSGQPATRLRAHAQRLCDASPPGERPLCLAVGPDAGGGAASAVVDLCGAQPRLLRAGPIAAEELAAALGLESLAAGPAPALDAGAAPRGRD